MDSIPKEEADKLELEDPTTASGELMKESVNADVADSGEFITITGPAWTLRWAAPELVAGGLPSLASDVWSLGWICWEVCNGVFQPARVAFDATSVPLRPSRAISLLLRINTSP